MILAGISLIGFGLVNWLLTDNCLTEWLLTNYHSPPCHCQFFWIQEWGYTRQFWKGFEQNSFGAYKNDKNSLLCQPFFKEEKYTVVHYHIFVVKWLQ